MILNFIYKFSRMFKITTVVLSLNNFAQLFIRRKNNDKCEVKAAAFSDAYMLLIKTAKGVQKDIQKQDKILIYAVRFMRNLDQF